MDKGKTPLMRYLRTCTVTHTLCVIVDNSHIVATVWIDREDLYRIPMELYQAYATASEWGTLPVFDKTGHRTEIPCLYINIEY